MKYELTVMAGVAWWIALLGFIAPALISAPHTELVLAGVALLVGSAYATYRVIRHLTTKKEPTK